MPCHRQHPPGPGVWTLTGGNTSCHQEGPFLFHCTEKLGCIRYHLNTLLQQTQTVFLNGLGAFFQNSNRISSFCPSGDEGDRGHRPQPQTKETKQTARTSRGLKQSSSPPSLLSRHGNSLHSDEHKTNGYMDSMATKGRLLSFTKQGLHFQLS